jgi:hypothetical protein
MTKRQERGRAESEESNEGWRVLFLCRLLHILLLCSTTVHYATLNCMMWHYTALHSTLQGLKAQGRDT